MTPVGQLGVGKQQLVEIAKALSKDVRLLILDEPTAALNDNDSAHLLDLLRRLRERGITSIMISHKLNEITAISDRVTVIRDGRTVETLTLAAGEVTQERIIRGMVGRDLESFYPTGVSNPGEEVLRVENWTVWHPTQDRKVVDDASLDVRAGEVVGIAGLMGAGRTELAMSIFGRSYGRDISGRIFMHGKEVEARNVAEAIDPASPTPPRTARSTASTSSRTSGATSPRPPWASSPAAAGSTATRRSRSPRRAAGA